MQEMDYFQNRKHVALPNWQKLKAACTRSNIQIIFTVIESLTQDGRERSLDYKISGDPGTNLLLVGGLQSTCPVNVWPSVATRLQTALAKRIQAWCTPCFAREACRLAFDVLAHGWLEAMLRMFHSMSVSGGILLASSGLGLACVLCREGSPIVACC